MEASFTFIHDDLSLTSTGSLRIVHAIKPNFLPLSLSADDWHSIAHQVAQLAHCVAQGKVGSGFDVAAAFFGSHIYRRFSRETIADILTSTQTRQVSRLDLVQRCLPHIRHEQHESHRERSVDSDGNESSDSDLQLVQSPSPTATSMNCKICAYLSAQRRVGSRSQANQTACIHSIASADVRGGAKTPRSSRPFFRGEKQTQKPVRNYSEQIHFI